MNIKKMFILFVALTVLYFLMQLGFKVSSHGHHVSYNIKTKANKLEVIETYTHHEKNEKDNYYFEIHDDEDTFTFQIFENLKNRNYVIKEIEYLKGEEYSCILPKFKDGKYYTDILCIKDSIIYPYQSIKGLNQEVDEFKESLEEYSEDKYQEDLKETLKKDTITIYRKNMIDDHYVALENYKGLYLINKKDVYKKIELFSSDQYKRELATFIEGKYIVADYNQAHNFNEFYVLDMKTGKSSKFISNNSLSLDAYVMGTIDGKVYIYDRSKKEQYTVNAKNGNLSKIGDTSSGIQVYENFAWKDYSSYDANKEVTTFSPYKINEEKWASYARVDKVGNKKSGYYYFFKKQDNKYLVYQASVQNTDYLTYLFTTTNIQNIIYDDSYIYFINGKDLYYYNKDTFVRKLVTDKELEFNESLKFGIWIS